MDQPPTGPTLLRVPPLPNARPRGRMWRPGEHTLPLPIDAYALEPGDPLWRVREVVSGRTVYLGPGPLHLMVSSAPF